MSRKEKTIEIKQRRQVDMIVCDGCGAEAPASLYDNDGMRSMYQPPYPMEWFRIWHGINDADACSELCAFRILEKLAKIDATVAVQVS